MITRLAPPHICWTSPWLPLFLEAIMDSAGISSPPPATAQGPQPLLLLSAGDPTMKPWCCRIPHAEIPLVFRVVSLVGQVREISSPNEFREPHKDWEGGFTSAVAPLFFSCSQNSVSTQHPAHHGRYELMPVLHQNHTEFGF